MGNSSGPVDHRRVLRPVIAEDGLSQTGARWSDDWTATDVDESKLRSLWWCVDAGRGSAHRSIEARLNAFEAWTSAVEAVWWVSAIDEAFFDLVKHQDGASRKENRYLAAREHDEDGQVVAALTWLRHRHAHQVVITGAGGPAEDFFRVDGRKGGPPFRRTRSLRWRPSAEIPAPGDLHPELKSLYDKLVGGRALQAPIRDAMNWFELVLSASGLGDRPPAGDATDLR